MEIILHTYGDTTTSLLLDQRSYTTVNGKKVLGQTVRLNFLKNISRYRLEALKPHTKEDFKKGDFTGWCKDCFNRVAIAVDKPELIVI